MAARGGPAAAMVIEGCPAVSSAAPAPTTRNLPRCLTALMAIGAVVGITACGGGAGQGSPRATPTPPAATLIPTPAPAPIVLNPDEVRAIMESAARATDREVAVAVTDRRGVILGVGTNFTVAGALTDPADCPNGSDCSVVNLAVQLARTPSFFSANATPLTSRSVRFISDIHFPPRVMNTGAAALFGIENTNRGCSFDAALTDDQLYDAGKAVPRPRSLAATLAGGSTLRCESPVNDAAAPGARAGCTTGIATLPGGVPIYKNGEMVGGIGVAIRGTTLVPDRDASTDDPNLLRKDDGDPSFDVAELAARAFAGEVTGFPDLADKGLVRVCDSTSVPRPQCCAAGCDFDILPARRLPFDPVIFIDGIEVPEVARNPNVDKRVVGTGAPIAQLVVDPDGAEPAAPVPSGYLISPTASTAGAEPISAEEVDTIIQAGIAQANATRAAIRLPLDERARMILAVADTNGALLGVFRMDDATLFSLDVATAKSRNVLYFSNPAIDPVDTLDTPAIGDVRGQAFPPGTAITNRTISFGAQPFFPSGIDGTAPGPFRRVFIEDSLNPCTNGREPANGRQNGIVFFPGSAPLYRDGVLIGGLGISGDGVEQDDLVTFGGTQALPGLEPAPEIRADQVFVRGVRLPYLKFNRNPSE